MQLSRQTERTCHGPVQRNPRQARFQSSRRRGRPAAPQAAPVSATPAPPAPITVVDVLGQLEGLAAANPQKLNWKVSIVDLLKLLGLDSTLTARKELATELGCPAPKDGRFGANEYVAAQDRAAEARRERRQYSEGTAGLIRCGAARTRSATQPVVPRGGWRVAAPRGSSTSRPSVEAASDDRLGGEQRHDGSPAAPTAG